MNIDNYKFAHEMKVRDYECDLQGIVNNANYQHYMEHSRHELLDELGVNFGKLHEDGIDAMVAKITIEYKIPLRSGDKFVVGINLERKGPKIIFYQDIYRISIGYLTENSAQRVSWRPSAWRTVDLPEVESLTKYSKTICSLHHIH